MDYCCSQCTFTTQFESALMMHRQLHHDTSQMKSQTNTVPSDIKKGIKLSSRSMSATKLFEKLRTRLSRSKTLFSHPEENVLCDFDLSTQSECTSKALKDMSFCNDAKDIFSCHLCSFDADRITVLDRHLLNDHKLTMDSLLKLVMAKTRNGLEDETPVVRGTRQPYYQLTGEFVIETVTPQTRVLKHVAVNTDLTLTGDVARDTDVLLKMQSINEYMCKYVDSSNTLKRVLTKEMDQRLNRSVELGLGEPESGQVWEKAHSERLGRTRIKHETSEWKQLFLSKEIVMITSSF